MAEMIFSPLSWLANSSISISDRLRSANETGRALREIAYTPQYAQGVSQEIASSGQPFAQSRSLQALVDPTAALGAAQAYQAGQERMQSTEDIAAMRIASAKANGIDTTEGAAAAEALAQNTAAHTAIVNQAINASRTGNESELDRLVQEAQTLEANNGSLIAKAMAARVALGYAKSVGINKNINDILSAIGRQDVALRLAKAQENLIPIEKQKAEAAVKSAQADLANVELQRKKLEAEAETATETAKGGTPDQRKAAGFVSPMISGDSEMDSLGKPSAISSVQEQIFAGSTPFGVAARKFLNSVLRRESGAAITEGDYATVGPQYIPGIADSPDVIARKSALRKQRIADMKAEAGPAWGDSSSATGGMTYKVVQ